MFKKHALTVAVLALTSGIAFAENEAMITQYGDSAAATATIEQIYADGNSNYGQIVQQAVTGDAITPNAVVYQGAASDVGAVDPTGPTATNAAGTAIDLAAAAWLDATSAAPYGALTTTVSNFAYVKQNTADGSQALIAQLSVDDAAAFAVDSTVNFPDGLTRDNAIGTMGLADGGDLTVGDFALISGGVAEPILANVTDTAASTDNIAGVSQGSIVLDRGGVALDPVAVIGDVSSIALILQLGSSNIAQVLQAGEQQFATVIQADTGNDAYVAQYGGTGNIATVIQVAINDTATVYQTGDGNIASITQHQAF